MPSPHQVKSCSDCGWTRTTWLATKQPERAPPMRALAMAKGEGVSCFLAAQMRKS